MHIRARRVHLSDSASLGICSRLMATVELKLIQTSLLYAGCSFVKAIPRETVEDYVVSTAMVARGAIGAWRLYKRRDN